MTRDQKLDLAVRLTAAILRTTPGGPLVVLRVWMKHGVGEAAARLIRERFAQPLGRWAETT